MPPKVTWVALAALCFLTLFLGTVQAASLPLWSDELATLHIAGAPSWAEMLHRSRAADLNPPLEPSLVRLSIGLFGAHEFGARVPSILGYTLFLGCLFLLLRRRISLPWALFGALLPLVSKDASYFLTEARPYAILLGSLGVAILAYDRLCHEDRAPAWTRVVLAFALCCVLLSHIFGAYAVAAFFLAEAVRSWRNRRLDLLTWGALLLPLVCCITYAPLFKSQSGGHVMIYQESSRPSLYRGLKVYYELLFTPVSVLLKLAFLVIFFLPFYPKSPFYKKVSERAAFWALVAGLLATPMIVAAMFLIRAPYSGFYTRYSLAVLYPGYLLLVTFLAWRSGEHKVLGWALAAGALAGVCYTFAATPRDLRLIAHNGLLNAPAVAVADGGLGRTNPPLPIVVDNALRFMEADYELPALNGRLVYVTDEQQAMHFTHQNARESISSMAHAFQLASRVETYPQFLADHRQFLVMSLPGQHDWFLQAMQERKAEMKLLRTAPVSGMKEEIWLVSLP